MKILVRILILFCVLYFVIGLPLSWIGYLPDEVFNKYAGWAGGLASACGLISLTLPRLTTTDIQSIEVDALRRVTDATDEIRRRQEELDSKTAEIERLTLQKSEIEVLVLQSSQKLFLEDQYRIREKNIRKIIDDNADLGENLFAIGQLREKIESLKLEIDKNPNIELLNSVIESIDAPRTQVYSKDPFLNALAVFVAEMARAVDKSLRILWSK